ncbi:class I SAM-dependent RNA methyltransferase [Pacificimonas sp. WHA3]|uniref:Class I SAM-dependent RNA methyltransferase n=1 Tax=Pacificimonas pallii TaxID=2827236 RepID=A0ABS6SDY5_9SPHN|nr:methyltransferase [Pacificimonas pallii]MBV7256570.1 class I SAM-dependent RNA methyltransferase [Pacificimonas pallii]
MTRIVRMAARGDGVTADGTFVAGAVTGDAVDGGRVIPGPHHVEPVCRHVSDCGGCQLQHADEQVLAKFAVGRVLATLASVDLQPETMRPVHLSPPKSRRRVSLRAALTAEGLVLGFNQEGSHSIFDMTECHVMTDALLACVQSLRPVIAGLLKPGWMSAVAITETAGGFDVVLSNLEPSPKTTSVLSTWAKRAGAARVSLETHMGVETAVQRAVPTMRFAGVDVELPPGAFLQATADGEAALVAAVRQMCEEAGRVADLFSGLGTFALPLSDHARIMAVDGARPAVQALATAARRARRRIEVQHRDLFRQPLAARELDKFDVVVLDPPRAGAKAQAEMIAASKVDNIAYVSCNPNTFARDARILCAAGFRIAELWPVGQFRWSTHVELAAHFIR